LFDGDNAPFLEALRDRGFTVAEQSSSNYMYTELTLTSMLNMAAMPDIPEVAGIISGETTDRTALRRVLNDNRAFAFLRDRGYRIAASSPGYEHVSLRQADTYLDGGELNDFEYHLVRSTALQWTINRIWPSFFGDQQRERIVNGLDAIPRVISQESERPVFGFIHIPAPHPPIVFGADGSPAPPPTSGDVFEEAESIDDLDVDAYAAQVSYLGREVIDRIEAGLRGRADDDPPIVIVMSDHGAAPRPEVFEGGGSEEHHANLFAALTPGRDGVFPEDISPVNVFRILFDEYFGASLEPLPNRPYEWGSAIGTQAR
jgi:hypothetical protein